MKSQKTFYYVKKYDFCDRDHFWIAKGLAMLIALVCWVGARYDYIISADVKHVYWSAIALFIVCSGFGVSESYLKKRGLFHYVENKIIKIWIPSLIVLIGIALIQGESWISWLPKYPVALKGNFMYVIFCEYIVFWISFRSVHNRTARLLILFGASLIAFIFIPETFSAKEVLFCFPVGVLASQKVWKRKVREFKAGGKCLLLLASAAVAAAGWFAAGLVTLPYLSTLIWAVFYMAAAAAFLILVWILKAIPVMGIFAPVGVCSFMLYMLYDSVFDLLKPGADWRICVLVVVILLIGAALLTWLRDLLVRWNKNMRRKGKTQLKGSM